MSTEHPHLGRKVKRLREILGMKQETLALELGSDWSQKKISLLEAKDMIERPILEQLAKALKIPVEAIENFDESATVLNIQNNYEGANPNNSGFLNAANVYDCTFNPFDKMVQLMEENKKLYERLLEEKEEKVRLLEDTLRMMEGMVKK